MTHTRVQLTDSYNYARKLSTITIIMIIIQHKNNRIISTTVMKIHLCTSSDLMYFDNNCQKRNINYLLSDKGALKLLPWPASTLYFKQLCSANRHNELQLKQQIHEPCRQSASVSLVQETFILVQPQLSKITLCLHG